MSERHKAIAAAYLVLQKEEKVLFLKRHNVKYYNDYYGLPSGHVEENEPIISAMQREAKEEIGINIKREDLILIHVRDRNAPDGHYLDFFFTCKAWEGEIVNQEPHKCSEVIWSNPETQPHIVPYITDVLCAIQRNEQYSIENW